MYDTEVLILLLLVIHIIFKRYRKLKEGYFGTFQIHPYLNYVGIIYSSTLPQKVYSLYELYDGIHSKYEYYYRYIDSYYYNYEFIQIPTHHDLFDGSNIKIDNTDEIYTVNLRTPYRRGPVDIQIYPARVFGYNPIYDKYNDTLYKRPVRYNVSGDFVTSIGKYGSLVQIKGKDDKTIIDGKKFILYEKEMDPLNNKFKYYVENGEQYEELNRSSKIKDEDIIYLGENYYIFIKN